MNTSAPALHSKHPAPTSHPPCRFAQRAKSPGSQSNSLGRPPEALFNRASRAEKRSAENSCGRRVISRWLALRVTTISSDTAIGRKTPAPAKANQITASAPTARITFKKTSPAPAPALYAAAITISASHSWLIQGMSLVNEYGSCRGIE